MTSIIIGTLIIAAMIFDAYALLYIDMMNLCDMDESENKLKNLVDH